MIFAFMYFVLSEVTKTPQPTSETGIPKLYGIIITCCLGVALLLCSSIFVCFSSITKEDEEKYINEELISVGK